MIRSGSTLQYNITAELLERDRSVRRIGILDRPDQLDSLLAAPGQDLVIKMHRANPLAIADASGSDAKVVYIHRDLRDVAASLMQKNKLSLQEILTAGKLEQAWRDYQAWASVPAILIQRYEDVVHDLSRMIVEIADFLEVAISPEDVSEIGQANCLNTRQREQEDAWSLWDRALYPIRRRIASKLRTWIGVDRTRAIGQRLGTTGAPRINPHTELHTNHIAAGDVGSYRRVMSLEDQRLVESVVQEITAT